MLIKFWLSLIIALISILWNFFNLKIMNKQKEKFEKSKQEHEKELTDLKTKYETILFKHKLGFEKEFNIYKELWSELAELRLAIKKLNPQLEFASKDVLWEDELKIRIERANECHNKVWWLIEKNKPFYDESIYIYLNEMLKISRREFYSVQMPGMTKDEDYYKKSKKNLENIFNISEQVENAIRIRIEKIT